MSRSCVFQGQSESVAYFAIKMPPVQFTANKKMLSRCTNVMTFPPYSSKVHHNRHGIRKHRAVLQRFQQMAPRVPDPVLT